MRLHPGKEWTFAPGAHSGGSDIASVDGEVIAEVFAAVDPKNNGKLRKDIEKVRAEPAMHRYVFFWSPSSSRDPWTEGGVQVVPMARIEP